MNYRNKTVEMIRKIKSEKILKMIYHFVKCGLEEEKAGK